MRAQGSEGWRRWKRTTALTAASLATASLSGRPSIAIAGSPAEQFRARMHIELMQRMCAVRQAHAPKRASSPRSQKRVVLYDLHDQIVTYERAWHWQKERAHAIASGRCEEQALVLLQHPPVYTLGTRSTLDNVKFDSEYPPHPVYRTERGGEVTYHGPGQLVVYPIIDLKNHGKDLHAYLRLLEGVIIDALAKVSGIVAHRESGLTGVPR